MKILNQWIASGHMEMTVTLFTWIIVSVAILLSSCDESREDMGQGLSLSEQVTETHSPTGKMADDILLERIGISQDEWDVAINSGSAIAENASALDSSVFHSLIFLHSSLCFQVEGGSTETQANIIEGPCTEAEHEKFALVASEDEGYYFLKNLKSSQCVTISELTDTPGANIFQFTCIESLDLQKFQLVEKDDGSKVFINKFSGNCINSELGQPELNNVIQWTCNENPNQRVSLDEILGGIL